MVSGVPRSGWRWVGRGPPARVETRRPSDWLHGAAGGPLPPSHRTHEEAQDVEHGSGNHAGQDAGCDEVIHRLAPQYPALSEWTACFGAAAARRQAGRRRRQHPSAAAQHSRPRNSPSLPPSPQFPLPPSFPGAGRGRAQPPNPRPQTRPYRSESVCSDTCMVPSSAANALPTRPATMMEVTTGISSRAMASPSTPPTMRVRPSRVNSLRSGAGAARAAECVAEGGRTHGGRDTKQGGECGKQGAGHQPPQPCSHA